MASAPEPLAPEWLGDYPVIIWIILTCAFPTILVLNKAVRKAMPPPLGPGLWETGDVDPRAARKGWLLTHFPFFIIAAAIVGSGATAPFAAEPSLRRYLQWYLFPLGLVMVPFIVAIDYRRWRRFRVADSETLGMCTLAQAEFLRTTIIWAYHSLLLSEEGGTLAPHAPRVRAAVVLALCTCAITACSMIWRAAVLGFAVMHKARLLPGTTIRLYFERLYLGASLPAKVTSAPRKQAGAAAAAVLH